MKLTSITMLVMAALATSAGCGPPMGTLTYGTPRTGTLSPTDVQSILGGVRVQDTETIGVGSVVTVTLCALAFDPYLIMTKDGMMGTMVAEDDDSAANLNARIVYSPPSADQGRLYTLHVTTSADYVPPANADWTLTAFDSSMPALRCP